jgi:hypothetical protein
LLDREFVYTEHWENDPFMSLSWADQLLQIIGPVVDLQVCGFAC